VGSGPVSAVFFNFHPAMVARAVPACWDVVAPSELVLCRATAAAEALEALCPSLDRVLGALPPLRRAAARCNGDGRLLTGANGALWPALEGELAERALARNRLGAAEVWQACTTLREHRGDGHVAALLCAGLSGLEAHLLVTGTEGTAPETLRDNRGWSEEQWRTGAEALCRRGLLGETGRATEPGHAMRQSVEALTDEMAEVPFAELSDDELVSLYAALRECAGQIQQSGLYPFPNPMGLPPL
jgi:hypothetical protein